MAWQIPAEAGAVINAEVARCQALGLHVQPVSIGENGFVKFADRSQWVVPEFLDVIRPDLKGADVLCVGCNTGPDLSLLEEQGVRTLHGLEWQPELAQIASTLVTLAGHAVDREESK